MATNTGAVPYLSFGVKYTRGQRGESKVEILQKTGKHEITSYETVKGKLMQIMNTQEDIL